MDDQSRNVTIVVSRIDSTSPMHLCLEVADDLRAEGHQVEILEIKAYLAAGRLVEMFRMLGRTGPRDVMIACGALSDICLGAMRLLGGGRQRSFVSYLHCDQWQDLKFERNIVWAAIYYAFWRGSLYLKHHVCCVSYDILNNFPRRLASRSRVIYNHVTSEAEASKSSASDDDLADIKDWIARQQQTGRKVVVAFGLFRRRKNFTSLIEAVDRLPHVAMVLAGRGPDESALRLAATRLSADGRALIHDFIARPARLCAYADVYASCSHSEGFGLANLEAARSGIPVVLPCHAVNLEVLADYPNVTFYNPHAPLHLSEELARAIALPVEQRTRSDRPNRYSRRAFRASWAQFMAVSNAR